MTVPARRRRARGRGRGRGRGGKGEGKGRGRGGGGEGRDRRGIYTAYCLRFNLVYLVYCALASHPGLSRDVQQEKTSWYEVGPRTIVVTKVDDGIVWVLRHALEGAEVRSVFGHGLPNRSVQVA